MLMIGERPMLEQPGRAARPSLLAVALLAGALAVSVAKAADSPRPGAAAAPTVSVPEDRVVTVNGVDVACTGIGQTRNDPQWAAYPVRVEISGAHNEYLAGAVVSVRDHAGRPVLSVACDGPWVLVKLPAGNYRIVASLAGSDARPRSAPVRSPRRGQLRVVMQFPTD
jgi:hypothetical protein